MYGTVSVQILARILFVTGAAARQNKELIEGLVSEVCELLFLQHADKPSY